MSLTKLEQGSFYRFGSHQGFRPVHVFVGRIDEPPELRFRVDQPVISTVILSMREGMPRIGLAPFLLSALFMDPVEPILPVDMADTDFDTNYRGWRAAWEAGEAEIWDIGPAQVYNQAMKSILASQKMIRRPN